jgi:hypothetical protein
MGVWKWVQSSAVSKYPLSLHFKSCVTHIPESHIKSILTYISSVLFNKVMRELDPGSLGKRVDQPPKIHVQNIVAAGNLSEAIQALAQLNPGRSVWIDFTQPTTSAQLEAAIISLDGNSPFAALPENWTLLIAAVTPTRITACVLKYPPIVQMP